MSPSHFPHQLSPIFEALPTAGLHLDIGHSNLDVAQNTAAALIQRFRSRLAHLHLHDSRGGHADLHLALGMGSLDVKGHVRMLRASGYDATITLEVFFPRSAFPRVQPRSFADNRQAAA